MHRSEFFQPFLSSAAFILSALIGPFNELLIAILICIGIDYITGVIRAVVKKKVRSDIGAKGILKKVGILCVVALANVIDVYVLKMNDALRSCIIVYYIANEAISITENMAGIGLPIPNKLKSILDELKEDS